MLNFRVMCIKHCISTFTVDYMYANCVGNKSSRIFVLGGDALEDANAGQSLTGSGTVVVSSAAWEACSRDKFFANFIGDGKFVEVIQVSACTLL